MALSKDKHYWTQLRIAFSCGQWDVTHPAKAPNGVFLTWSELFRKFNKHCTGFKDAAEILSQTRDLSLSLGVRNLRGSGSDDHYTSSKRPLDLGAECLLQEERMQEAENGYNTIKGLPYSDSSKLALAYYAYALSRPSECLSIIAEVENLTDIESKLPIAHSTFSASATSVGQSSASTWTSSFGSTETTIAPDIQDGHVWAVIEILRSICLKGMSHEKLFGTDPEESLRIYVTASPLISKVISEIPRSVPTGKGSNNADFSSYTQYRELWRWIDRLLWRSIAIAAQISTDDTTLRSLFQLHQACSAHWPPTFRSEHRSTISVLYLRFLISTSTPISACKAQIKPPHWLATARSVIQDYRSVLSASTKFPRAGRRNSKVEDFVDLCVAVWEVGGAVGEHAGWVIDILWWATRLTFNSYRVFRHMTRLFYVSGDVDLATRTLKLYTQVVSKAWVMANTDAGQAREEGSSSSFEMDSENVDTDKNWVETLVQGSRMLCRIACAKSGSVLGSTGNGVAEAKKAGKLLEMAKTRLDSSDKLLVASVYMAEGVWNAVMAYKEQDPHTRTDRLSQAVNLCKMAVETCPTSSRYYHLALSLARPGPWIDINQAIIHARCAVEEDPTEIRHWHLLGILLIATDDWKKAKAVLEYGAAIGEEKGEDEEIRFFSNGVDERGSAIEGIPTTDSAPIFQSSHLPLLERDSIQIPKSSTLLRPIPDHPPPSRKDIFEQSLQLRMTQLALVEYVGGPEGAVDKWLEVFQWVAEQKHLTNDDRRMSVDSYQAVASDTNSISNQTIPARPRMSMDTIPHTVEEETNDVPITITPASPLDQTHFSSSQTVVQDLPKEESRSLTVGRESSAGKRMSRLLKSRVHRGQERISSISKIISNKNNNDHLRRTNSAPDMHSLLGQYPYQASSIHSRKRLTFGDSSRKAPSAQSPPPPPPPPLQVPQPLTKWDNRAARDRRLLSDLWTMSAATFRRLGKIDQAKAAIQEAEVRDENNPSVWIQLGLYHMTSRDEAKALQAINKALFITPENTSAIIQLCRIYLSANSNAPGSGELDPDRVDLAAGMLSDLTDGDGWDVPEAWYFLAKAYKMQGRCGKERECLSTALMISETTRVRRLSDAVGWSL